MTKLSQKQVHAFARLVTDDVLAPFEKALGDAVAIIETMPLVEKVKLRRLLSSEEGAIAFKCALAARLDAHPAILKAASDRTT